MLPLISVIVPIYNTELYLDKCMQSILNQTYRNLEIILVDDGSTDNSSQMCDLYAGKDSRIRVIHKENGGQSSARNVGLNVCTGDYISFVDSDDWIELDMYSTLVEQLEKHGVDLAVSGRYDAYENSEVRRIGKQLGKNGVFSAYDILPQMALGQLSDFSVCDKLHKRNLWENIRFPEGEIYEDFAVMYKVLLAAGSVFLCDKPLYTYYHRSNSTVTGGFREALIFYPKQTREFLEFIESRYPEYLNCAVWTHIKAVQVLLISLLKADRSVYILHTDTYEHYIQDIKKYKKIWCKDKKFSRVDRLLCRILLHKCLARMFFQKRT